MLELKLDTDDEEEEVFFLSITLLLWSGEAFTTGIFFAAP